MPSVDLKAINLVLIMLWKICKSNIKSHVSVEALFQYLSSNVISVFYC